MDKTFNDIMLDLETLGTLPGCGILSIGAQAFNPLTEALGPTFHAIIDRNSNLLVGLTENPETVAWHKVLDADARRTFELATVAGAPLVDTLNAFSRWFLSHGDASDVRIWGNGADFDQPILAAAYARSGLVHPWLHFNSRCYRTLKSFVPNDRIERGVLTHHNALHDAIAQATHAIKLLRKVHARVEQS